MTNYVVYLLFSILMEMRMCDESELVMNFIGKNFNILLLLFLFFPLFYMSKNIFEMLKYVQDTSFDTEFGVKSVNDSLLLDSKSTLTKRNSITTTSLLKDGTSHFRIIICGDSGKGYVLCIYYTK